MRISDGYSIEQYISQNQIVITLPPTTYTVHNTQNRRVELTNNELMAILVAVKGMYEWKENKKNKEMSKVSEMEITYGEYLND